MPEPENAISLENKWKAERDRAAAVMAEDIARHSFTPLGEDDPAVQAGLAAVAELIGTFRTEPAGMAYIIGSVDAARARANWVPWWLEPVIRTQPSTTTSQVNADMVRRGRCWECFDTPLVAGTQPTDHTRLDLHRHDDGEEWFVCPRCDKQWRLDSPEVIIERLPLAAFAEPIAKGTLRVGDHIHTEAIILADGTQLPIEHGDTWPVPPTARYAEYTWIINPPAVLRTLLGFPDPPTDPPVPGSMVAAFQEFAAAMAKTVEQIKTILDDPRRPRPPLL